MESFRIHIRKEALKFAAAHMTVFPDGTKEALHGHNYRTDATFDLRECSLDKMVAFHDIKAAMAELCDRWDEKVLLARDCPRFKVVSQSAKEIEFQLCGKRYVLPADEVVLLPADNIITETLAAQFGRDLIAKLGSSVLTDNVVSVEIRVDEMTGQGATWKWSRK